MEDSEEEDYIPPYIEPSPVINQKISFSTEKADISQKINTILEKYFVSKNTYSGKESSEWISDISEQIIQYLYSNSQSFKYSMNSIILERKGGRGFHMNSSSIWDTHTDGNCLIKYQNDSFICIVNVFAYYLHN